MGFAFLEKENKKIRVLEYGVISTPPKISLSEKLLLIAADLNELIDLYQPTIAGVEKLFFVRNVTNGIDVAHARGVILYTLASRGIIFQEYTPLQVKQSVVGYGKATKEQVTYMTMNLLGIREKIKPDDAADALAIAICTAHSSHTDTLKQILQL